VPKKGHIPERSCVVCKKKLPKVELIRLCYKEGEILIDTKQILGGRGAYLCKDCITKKDLPKVQAKLKKALRIKSADEN